MEPILMERVVVPGLSLSGSYTVEVDLLYARINGDVFFKRGFTATGEVRALGAQIDGQLFLEGATLANEGGTALNLDRARISGGAFLDKEFIATGEVSALGAQIDGQLSLQGATLTNEDGYALSLDRARISGGAFLNENFTATGEVRALGPQIDGQLSLEGATLTNEDGYALNLDRARISGGAFLDKGFTATGEVRALEAQIDGQLSLQGATLTNEDGTALNLDGARISGGAFLNKGFTATGAVVLNFTRFNVLVLDRAPNPSSTLIVTGWSVSDVHGPLNEPQVVEAWLDTTPEHEFSAQPWHELAAVFERQGRPSHAKQLRFMAARWVAWHSPWWARPMRWGYGLLTGYGYYPLLAAGWLVIAALVAGALVYDMPAAHPEVADFNSWLFGAAVVIPPAAAITPSSWTITSPSWLAWTLVGLKAFGWLQTVLLLAGITGLLKKG